MCTKLELARSKGNEIPEVNVLQKFSQHALYAKQAEALDKTSKISASFTILLLVYLFFFSGSLKQIFGLAKLNYRMSEVRPSTLMSHFVPTW